MSSFSATAVSRPVAVSARPAFKAYVCAALIFCTSRAIIAASVAFAASYLPQNQATLWNADAGWATYLLRWDAEWYFRIANAGYSFDGDPLSFQPVVFYPLFPLLCRSLAWLSGLNLGLSMVVVANLCGLAAILLLFRLSRRYFSEETSLGAIALISFFPGSLFLSAGYSESVFLLLAVVCLSFLERGHFVAASLAASLATGTRSTGIVLLPVILYALLRAPNIDGWRRAGLVVVCSVLAVAGLLAFMGYQWLSFGQPLAFAQSQAAYHGAGWTARIVEALTLAPIFHIEIKGIGPGDVDRVVFVAFAGLTLALVRTLSREMTLYAAGILLLPYVALAGGPQGLTSMTRFSLLAFPVFIGTAHLLKARPAVTAVLCAVLASQLVMWSALFSQWHWVG